jgi:hypothetical protein
MCFLCGTNCVSISQKTAFFIVTAVKTSNLNKPTNGYYVVGIVCTLTSF